MKQPFTFNQFDTFILSSNLCGVYMKSQQVKWNGMGSRAERLERETESNGLIEQEKECLL